MTVTEITAIFNTTDEVVQFINTETPSDSKKVPPQSAVSLKTAETAGAYVPWYDPPIFGGFSRRHMRILVVDLLLAYFWQRGDYIYYCTALGSDNLPGKAFRVPGIATIGSPRVLVVRYEPERQYGFFFAESAPLQQQEAARPGGILPRIL
jgi:hypothetical protein